MAYDPLPGVERQFGWVPVLGRGGQTAGSLLESVLTETAET